MTMEDMEKHTHRFNWIREIDRYKCEDCDKIVTREEILDIKQFLGD